MLDARLFGGKMFEQFVTTEQVMTSWIPLTALVASACLLVGIGLRTFVHGRFDPLVYRARAAFIASAVLWAVALCLFFWKEPDYARWEKVITPGIRKAQAGFFGVSELDAKAVLESEKVNQRSNLRALPWYRRIRETVPTPEYLGYKLNPGSDSGSLYFKIGNNIAYLDENDPLIQYDPKLKEPMLELERYVLTDKKWETIGFMDDRGPYVWRIRIPSSFRDRKFAVPEDSMVFQLRRLDYHHIY